MQPYDIELLIKTYLASSTIRPEVLFSHFLPTGYRATTLSSVESAATDAVIFAKTHIGMLITLYDDLADHPQYRNPKLLAELYHLNIGQDRSVPAHLGAGDRKIFELARFLFLHLASVLKNFPNSEILIPALRFDLEQFYSCNKHSELTTLLPTIRNLSESQTLGPHNMGMVAAGTIDLMASRHFNMEELGKCREVFLLGQRLGRISNLIFTLKREIFEGDSTNEILISHGAGKSQAYQSLLLKEFEEKLNFIKSIQLQSFSTSEYAQGLLDLHELYRSLEGRI